MSLAGHVATCWGFLTNGSEGKSRDNLVVPPMPPTFFRYLCYTYIVVFEVFFCLPQDQFKWIRSAILSWIHLCRGPDLKSRLNICFLYCSLPVLQPCRQFLFLSCPPQLPGPLQKALHRTKTAHRRSEPLGSPFQVPDQLKSLDF